MIGIITFGSNCASDLPGFVDQFSEQIEKEQAKIFLGVRNDIDGTFQKGIDLDIATIPIPKESSFAQGMDQIKRIIKAMYKEISYLILLKPSERISQTGIDELFEIAEMGYSSAWMPYMEVDNDQPILIRPILKSLDGFDHSIDYGFFINSPVCNNSFRNVIEKPSWVWDGMPNYSAVKTLEREEQCKESPS